MRKSSTILLFLVMVGFCGLLSATTVRPLNLVQISQSAKKAFYGKCVKVEPVSGAIQGIPVMEYTFEVKKAIKGVAEGERFVFRQVRAGEGGQPGIPGVPEYRTGQEYLLFLHGESERGLTSPVGMAQGTFKAVKTADGELGFVNLVNNRNLALGLTADTASKSGLTQQELRLLESRAAIPLLHFTRIVNKMMQVTPENPNK